MLPWQQNNNVYVEIVISLEGCTSDVPYLNSENNNLKEHFLQKL